VRPYLPVVLQGELIQRISVELIDDKDDWQVILALHQMGFAGLVTLDPSMLTLAREVATIHQTRATVVAIDAAGHNPLRATGQLLLHAHAIANGYIAAQPQVFQIAKPRSPTPLPAWAYIGKIASGEGHAAQQTFDAAKLSVAELDTPVI
jgi:hypothetical protein